MKLVPPSSCCMNSSNVSSEVPRFVMIPYLGKALEADVNVDDALVEVWLEDEPDRKVEREVEDDIVPELRVAEGI